jgi:hypothetical protein
VAGTINQAVQFLGAIKPQVHSPDDRFLHRSAVMGVPQDETFDAATIETLVSQLAEYEGKIDSGLHVIAHAWKIVSVWLDTQDVCGLDRPDKPSRRTDPFVTPSLLLNPWYEAGWDVCERTARNGEQFWTVCTHSGSPTAAVGFHRALVVSVEYRVAHWSFDSAWALPTTGQSSRGWLRHWERCCHRMGAVLLTVSQTAPCPSE